ncbi:M20 family metallo-hydrolase [Paraburkholderia rhizosphaerae]|uniref:N-carbamoyl-L-amino-acid hydrolase n=1 Tax=Paraburkholderia rhizosphaerae TaxID=480658 RepID=A0A4R8LJP2_9BURK|nr:M20 family metallo-hydrolase [Paraburkholderia rhizosphaerae]TDY42484.1 N-carbamoyl-L-amino-acid hydrolase [Paraburkholderia rhizosphaerae]
MNHSYDDTTSALRAAEHVDAARLLRSIDALATIGARGDGGVDRPALSTLEIDARRGLIERAQALGCTVSTDACANLFFRRAGEEDLPPVITGSHIDTQPTGGRLDGAYGVLAGFECLAALADAGVHTRRPLEVAIWTNEEGSRFQPGAMGSSTFVDPARLAGFRSVRDAAGVTFGATLDAHRTAFPSLATRAPGAAHAFIELHIEQGPLLELAGTPLGVVTGIQGVRWHSIRCTGAAAHAGTTPMRVRRDAMTLAVRVRGEIEAFALELGGDAARITFGSWHIEPNSINTIPSTVTLTVDFRHPDPAVLARFDAALAACIAHHGADVHLEPLFEHPPVHFADSAIARVRSACDALGARSQPIVSGAFHDALHLAKQCATAMIFVPSRGGISHNPLEATDDADLVLGTRALAHCLVELCNEAH